MIEMTKTIAIVMFIVVTLPRCHSNYMHNRKTTSREIESGYAATIYHDKTSESDYLRIDKVINKKCSCADAIAERYAGNRLIYRLYYGCSISKTRKELFSYCSRGMAFAPRVFEGTADKGIDSSSMLDSTDIIVIHKIDSFIKTRGEQQSQVRLCKKEIGGFERAKYARTNN